MLSRATDDLGNYLEIVTVRFKILPESNPIHVKEVLNMLKKSVEHLNYHKESVYPTFDSETGMTLLDISAVPENKVNEVNLVLEATLNNFKNIGALDSYTIS